MTTTAEYLALLAMEPCGHIRQLLRDKTGNAVWADEFCDGLLERLEPLHVLENPSSAPSRGVCEETRLRIRVLLCAYAYEVKNAPLISDHEFDALCQKVDLSKTTNNKTMDNWFRKNFDPSTGMWVRKLPRQEAAKLAALYFGLYEK